MAAAKIRVSDIAKKMGKSEKDVIFQLRSLGAEINDASQVLEPEVIQALITGKKLVTRTRSVIMREDTPTPDKKKEAVRPPRLIEQSPIRKKAEAPTEESGAAAPPTVIIPLNRRRLPNLWILPRYIESRFFAPPLKSSVAVSTLNYTLSPDS